MFQKLTQILYLWFKNNAFQFFRHSMTAKYTIQNLENRFDFFTISLFDYPMSMYLPRPPFWCLYFFTFVVFSLILSISLTHSTCHVYLRLSYLKGSPASRGRKTNADWRNKVPRVFLFVPFDTILHFHSFHEGEEGKNKRLKRSNPFVFICPTILIILFHVGCCNPN